MGKKISKLIAEHLSYLPDLKSWTIENFKQIKDVGPVVGENIIQYFQDSENYKIILEMEKHGVKMLQTDEDRPRQVSSDAPLSGKTILFTGSLSMDRKKAQELAEKAGAKNISAVSGNLNILVVGADAGSKLEKAKKLNTVEIWTEEEFLQKIDQN
ncbi:MAG: hypothetical protein IPH93_14680 [Saprospiraceae bacterium]|nr:hypothetical protein [Saprospiraceae bacterium]